MDVPLHCKYVKQNKSISTYNSVNLQVPFNSSMVTKLPWARLGYDMFIFHSVWNDEEVSKVIPNAIHITLLRDPVSCYESNYVYMDLERIFK